MARQQIKEGEERFRATFEQAAVGIAHVSLNGGFLRINRQFCEIAGYSHEELSGLTFQDITYPDDLEADLDQMQSLLDGKENTYSMEKRYLRKGGQQVWINLTVSILRDDTGRPMYFVSVIEDITPRKRAEEALRESEGKFRNLVEQSPLSIQILNIDGQIIQVNEAWKKLWGISEEDLEDVLGKYNVLEDEEARKLGIIPLIEKAFRGEVVLLPEFQYDASNTMENLEIGYVAAKKRWVQARLYPIRNSNGKIVNVVHIEEDITERKQAEDKVQNYQQRLKALASQLTIAEERERRRIAADLHDHVGQSLALARMQLATAIKSTDDSSIADLCGEVSENLLEAIRDTKNLIFELSSPSMNEIGLGAALSEWLEENIEKKHGLHVEFIDDGNKRLLDDDVRSLLYRNVRELLTNVIKHGQANTVSVRLDNSSDSIRITVQDDGVGCDVQEKMEKANPYDSFGLFSIQERMTDLGGQMEILSEPGKGCTVILTVPVGNGEKKKGSEVQGSEFKG